MIPDKVNCEQHSQDEDGGADCELCCFPYLAWDVPDAVGAVPLIEAACQTMPVLTTLIQKSL